VILKYGDKPVGRSDDLVQMVTRTKPGTTVPIELLRDGQRKTVQVTVDTLDVEDQGPGRGEPSATGFGMTLRDIPPEMRSQLGELHRTSEALPLTDEHAGPR
jgi:serine protease Do